MGTLQGDLYSPPTYSGYKAQICDKSPARKLGVLNVKLFPALNGQTAN